jgi:Fic family protein
LTETAEKEIKNLKKAYDYFVTVKHVPGVIFKLEEDQIKEIHRIITDGLEMKDNMPGLYRSQPVFVGNREHGGVYRPPKNLADIESLMKEFVTWLNSEEILSLVPEIRAALAHYHFALIHPFGNGNGRTARIIEALILTAAGMKYMPVMLSNFYYKHIDEYFSVFSSSEQNAENDITPFLEFVLKGVVESLNNIKDNIIYFIRIFTLRDYYAFLHKEKFITQRQYDFLIMLLENMKTFSLSDLSNVSPFNVLYRTVSERTVRRDLHKLCDRSLLICEKDKYELNLRVIG